MCKSNINNVKGSDDVGVANLQAFRLLSFNTAPFVETMSNKLASLLERTSLPYITSAEQIQLAVIVDCMSEVMY
jgi:hypothetical protein